MYTKASLEKIQVRSHCLVIRHSPTSDSLLLASTLAIGLESGDGVATSPVADTFVLKETEIATLASCRVETTGASPVWDR